MSTEEDLLAGAVRKAARRLLPFLLLLYILAFLDRVNIGFAKQALLRDTGLGAAAYSFGAGIFFIGYALFEVPSNLIMHRVGARVWMCRIMVSWGLISAAMMFVTSAPVFYVLRFFLGVAEAGFFPGVILYLTYWFPAKNRGAMMGWFYFGPPLAQILGGPLSGLLLEMNGRGGLHGWQWMFLVEGLLATAVGLWTYSFLTNRPAEARWLSAAERTSLQARLDAEDRAKHDLDKSTAARPLRRSRILYFGFIYCLIQMSVYGVIFYLPAQVAQLLGREVGFAVGLVSAIPWVCAFIAAYLLPRLASRCGFANRVAAGALFVAGIGIAASTSGVPLYALIALCLATAGFIGAQPVFWTFPTNELTGAGAAGGIALINSLGAVGGFLAPNLRTFAETATASSSAGQYVLAAITVIASALMLSLRERRPSPPLPSGRPD